VRKAIAKPYFQRSHRQCGWSEWIWDLRPKT
jgi:hypothetical protein